MKAFTEGITNVLGLLTLLGDGLIIALVINLFFQNKLPHVVKNVAKRLTIMVVHNGLTFSWIVAILAMSGSLFYSDVAGFAPCILCWYQRICMYPQVIILGIASVKKDVNILVYSIPLAGIGAAIAAFHYIEQRIPKPLIPCEKIGYSVSCSDKFFLRFGYITIPMMSFTAFVLIILFLWTQKKYSNPK